MSFPFPMRPLITNSSPAVSASFFSLSISWALWQVVSDIVTSVWTESMGQSSMNFLLKAGEPNFTRYGRSWRYKKVFALMGLVAKVQLYWLVAFVKNFTRAFSWSHYTRYSVSDLVHRMSNPEPLVQCIPVLRETSTSSCWCCPFRYEPRAQGSPSS